VGRLGLLAFLLHEVERWRGRYDRALMGDQLSLRLDAELPRLPVAIRPMLARSIAAPFDSADHLFEPSWGGERALAFVERDVEAPAGRGSDLRVLDRRGRDVAPLLPELSGLAARLDARSAVLDGELVVVDRAGRADAAALRARLSGAAGRPVAYLVFDLLYLEGRPLLGEPLERRRAQLERLLRAGDAVVTVPAIRAEGLALHAAVRGQGLAGTMARHRRSPYLPGLRSRLWRFALAPRPGSPPAPAGDRDVPEAIAPVIALFERLPLGD